MNMYALELALAPAENWQRNANIIDCKHTSTPCVRPTTAERKNQILLCFRLKLNLKFTAWALATKMAYTGYRIVLSVQSSIDSMHTLEPLTKSQANNLHLVIGSSCLSLSRTPVRHSPVAKWKRTEFSRTLNNDRDTQSGGGQSEFGETGTNERIDLNAACKLACG